MAARRKVIQVITRMIVGGAQETTLLSCARMDPMRYEMVLVTGPQAGPEGSLVDEASDAGVRVIVEPHLVRQVAPSDARATFRLARLFRAERPDIVHTNSSKAGIIGRAAARLAKVPHVVHTVHGWSFHDHMHAATRAGYVSAERLAAKWSDTLIVVTSIDREKGLVHGIGTPSQYRLIRAGFDVIPFELARTQRTAARQALGMSSNARVVGSVMRLSEQKDPLTWIRAAGAIARRDPEAQFIVVGDGSLRREVEVAAEQEGITNRLQITGVRRDVAQCMAAFDVFLSTSLWEGLPKVVLQAMATGIPVVATPSDGVQEVLRHEESGLVVPPSNPEAAAAAVTRLLDSQDLRERLVTAAERVYPEFSEARMVLDLDELYSELLGDPPLGRSASSS
jgi:glycosyltransferase involved in cell wall biosynthesis